jgi:gluconokinase
MIIILMGVSGSGKTTVGEKLAERLDCEFADADDFHPPENVVKMRAGMSLNDEDRAPWLDALRRLIKTKLNEKSCLILACSALKQKYRDVLRVNETVRFIYLKGSRDLIEPRLSMRTGHFFSPALLQSQFEALEEPENALTIGINDAPEEIVEKILKNL